MNKSLLLRALLAIGHLPAPFAPLRKSADNCWHCGNVHHATCCRRSREETEHAKVVAARRAAPAT